MFSPLVFILGEQKKDFLNNNLGVFWLSYIFRQVYVSDIAAEWYNKTSKELHNSFLKFGKCKLKKYHGNDFLRFLLSLQKCAR